VEAERYRRPSEIMDFATLYATHCSGCHGAEGRAGPARPLADPLYLALVDPKRLASTVAAGVPGTSMPVFDKAQGGPLDEAQIRVLVDEIFSKWSAPTPDEVASLPPYSEADSRAAGHAPGDPVRGARAFGRFCASCHGVDGTGGSAGSVVDPSLLALVSDQMLRTSVIAGRPDLGMPDWRSLSRDRAMTPQEISDVVAWLAAQGGPDGARP
jgi:mono/diheme cytochrome c family protein